MCSKTKIDDPFPSGSNGKFGSVRREWDLKAKIGLFFLFLVPNVRKGTVKQSNQATLWVESKVYLRNQTTRLTLKSQSTTGDENSLANVMGSRQQGQRGVRVKTAQEIEQQKWGASLNSLGVLFQLIRNQIPFPDCDCRDLRAVIAFPNKNLNIEISK